MNDAWLFLGGLLFLFVLWVYSGGPNNPISFSGPYITPITGPNSVQKGYGPSANAYYSPANTNTESNNPAQGIDSARSPYANTVVLGYGDPRSSDARSEYVIVHLASGADTDITGWQIVDTKNNTHVFIPQGSRGSSSTKRDIILSDEYQDAYVVTGSRASDSLKDSWQDAWHALIGSTSDVWGNTSDTLTLLDRNEKVVDQYSY